jgi:hypothetical protein
MRLIICLFLSLNLYASDSELIEKLEDTKLNNMREIIQEMGFFHKQASFRVPNPYWPRYSTKTAHSDSEVTPYIHKHGRFRFFHNKIVHLWSQDLETTTEVCGVKFIKNNKKDYVLKTFSSSEAALAEGFIITHKYRCGTCSTLKDLAVYLKKPDLTTPARKCSTKPTLKKIRRCYEKEIGFTSLCAESWAYNSNNTKKACAMICMQEYGLTNIILNRYSSSNNRSDGSLNRCILCDEVRSGPGFKYSAGRTRRGSGIISAINRDDSEVFYVDHSLYFD